MFAARLCAAIAGIGVAGFALAPAHAASGTTLALDSALMTALGSNDVSVAAIEPGTLSGTTLSLPASASGKKVNHRGGLRLTSTMGYVALTNITLNRKTGKAGVSIETAYNDNQQEQVKNLLVFKGGKNTLKKNGKWRNVTVSLAKSAVIGGQTTDPAVLLSSSLQVPMGTVSPGQRLGKATIIVKR